MNSLETVRKLVLPVLHQSASNENSGCFQGSTPKAKAVTSIFNMANIGYQHFKVELSLNKTSG